MINPVLIHLHAISFGWGSDRNARCRQEAAQLAEQVHSFSAADSGLVVAAVTRGGILRHLATLASHRVAAAQDAADVEVSAAAADAVAAEIVSATLQAAVAIAEEAARRARLLAAAAETETELVLIGEQLQVTNGLQLWSPRRITAAAVG